MSANFYSRPARRMYYFMCSPTTFFLSSAAILIYSFTLVQGELHYCKKKKKKKSLAPICSSCKSVVARATSRTTSNSRIAPGCPAAVLLLLVRLLLLSFAPTKTGSSCRVSFTAYFFFLVHSFIHLFSFFSLSTLSLVFRFFKPTATQDLMKQLNIFNHTYQGLAEKPSKDLHFVLTKLMWRIEELERKV